LAGSSRAPGLDLVAEADPVSGAGNAGSPAAHNLILRIVSALVLAPLALAAAYAGGLAFICFWCVAATAVLWEWIALVIGSTNLPAFLVGVVALAISASMVALDHPITALLVVALGALAGAVFVRADRRVAVASGVIYAGVMLLAPTLLRAGDRLGFVAIVFLFAIVWTTDIFGYFFGRALGGPKLAPAISPKKTWSGAIAGIAGAAIAALLMASFIAGTNWFPIVFIAILLSVVAQIGDLVESGLKRHFGVKDSSQLIPGHGGFMDRLDGFWAAVLLGVLVGLARGGFAAPAQGLLIW